MQRMSRDATYLKLDTVLCSLIDRRIRPNIPRKNRKYFCDNNLALSFGSRVQFCSDGFSKLELPKKKRNTSVTKISYD